MMNTKYSIVVVRTGSHILIEAMLKSVLKFMDPDEIILMDHFFRFSLRGGSHGQGAHDGILKANNELVLLLDHDVIVTSKDLETRLLDAMKDPDVVYCGGYDYVFGTGEDPLLLPPVLMIRKSVYLRNNAPFNSTGNPCHHMMYTARQLGQKMVKLDLNKQHFHLHWACNLQYPTLMPFWRNKFAAWKNTHGIDGDFDDYVNDDGMDFNDHDWMNSSITTSLTSAIQRKEPWSMIRLGDLGMRHLYGHLHNPVDFAHASMEHPDLAMPSVEVSHQFGGEIIQTMREADYIDHHLCYKGLFNGLHGWRASVRVTDSVYQELGFIQPNGELGRRNICCSIQAYTAFVEEFETNFYNLLRGLKVLYIGPCDELGNLNARRNLELKDYGFYQLSLGAHWDRYNVMENFMKVHNPNDWDLVVVTGSLYGRILIGRIRRAGGRAYDMGQAIRFFPNNVFETAVLANKEQTFFRLQDNLAGKWVTHRNHPKVKAFARKVGNREYEPTT